MKWHGQLHQTSWKKPQGKAVGLEAIVEGYLTVQTGEARGIRALQNTPDIARRRRLTACEC